MEYVTKKHTTETLREDLSILSKAISSLLNEFERQTGVRIGDIHASRQSVTLESGMELDFRYAVKVEPDI